MFARIVGQSPDFRDAQALRAQAHETQAELERNSRQAFSAENTADRAREAMAAGEWGVACELLEQVAELHPDDEEVAAELARARVMVQVAELNATAAMLVEQGRWAEDMEKTEEAKSLDPHYRGVSG